MSRYEGSPDEFEPGSNGLVLRNKLGITDPVAMGILESELLAEAESYGFVWIDSDQKFDIELIRNLHQIWLARIYDFAGSYRTVNVSKGDVFFCPAPNIVTELERFQANILRNLTPCAGFKKEDLSLAISKVHAEFILIHPFREGNGRLGRLLAIFMASQAGFQIEYPFSESEDDPAREEYFRALASAFNQQDYVPLSLLFSAWISIPDPDAS